MERLELHFYGSPAAPGFQARKGNGRKMTTKANDLYNGVVARLVQGLEARGHQVTRLGEDRLCLAVPEGRQAHELAAEFKVREGWVRGEDGSLVLRAGSWGQAEDGARVMLFNAHVLGNLAGYLANGQAPSTPTAHADGQAPRAADGQVPAGKRQIDG